MNRSLLYSTRTCGTTQWAGRSRQDGGNRCCHAKCTVDVLFGHSWRGEGREAKRHKDTISDLSAVGLDVVRCLVELFELVSGVQFGLKLEVLLTPCRPEQMCDDGICQEVGTGTDACMGSTDESMTGKMLLLFYRLVTNTTCCTRLSKSIRTRSSRKSRFYSQPTTFSQSKVQT